MTGKQGRGKKRSSKKHGRRSEVQRERDLAIISELYLKGYSYYHIGQMLKEFTKDGDKDGYTLSPITVSADMKEVIERWRQAALMNIQEQRLRELEKINAIEHQYFLAWERSLELRTKKETRSALRGTGEMQTTIDDNGEVLETERMALIPIEEKSAEYEPIGDPRFLDGIMKCIDRRCKLLGLDIDSRMKDNKEEDDERNISRIELFNRLRKVLGGTEQDRAEKFIPAPSE